MMSIGYNRKSTIESKEASVNQQEATRKQTYQWGTRNRALTSSYYAFLGVNPNATPLEIRRAYRELSKSYHPDTTDLPVTIATEKFQHLNQAYGTLSNIESREAYDRALWYSRFYVIQQPPGFNQPVSASQNPTKQSSSAYLDPTERPLSPGEIFALFLMISALIGCLAGSRSRSGYYEAKYP
jgi:curved DNA-binding protein CbpA